MRQRYPAGNAGDGVVSFPDQLETERSGSETSDGVADLLNTHFLRICCEAGKVHNLQALLTLLQIMANAGNLIII